MFFYVSENSSLESIGSSIILFHAFWYSTLLHYNVVKSTLRCRGRGRDGGINKYYSVKKIDKTIMCSY